MDIKKSPVKFRKKRYKITSIGNATSTFQAPKFNHLHLKPNESATMEMTGQDIKDVMIVLNRGKPFKRKDIKIEEIK